MMVEHQDKFTILFSSLSAKLALLRSVISEVKSVSNDFDVIAADSNTDCYGADKVENFIKMPPIHDLSPSSLIKFCKENKIRFVIPTRDAELIFWAKQKELMSANGIGVMNSTLNAIELCEDKFTFATELSDAPIPPIRTSLSGKEMLKEYDRFVIKERRGSASRSIGLNLKKEDIPRHSQAIKKPVFQPFINGKEFSAETWIDKSGKCHGVILRWRLKVIDGESHESVTFSNPEWVKMLVNTFSLIKGLYGHILAQVIVDPRQNLHLVEINPRLGGKPSRTCIRFKFSFMVSPRISWRFKSDSCFAKI